MVVAGGSAAAAWKAELLAAAGATSMSIAEDFPKRCSRLPRARRASRSIVARSKSRSRRRGARGRRIRGRRRSRRLRGGGAPRGRAGQRDRQAGVLRFLVRRDRQPLAARDRHLDRWRGAGIRAGDPRQLEAMIPRGFAHWAEAARHGAARAGARAVVQRPPPLLAAIHRARGRKAG